MDSFRAVIATWPSLEDLADDTGTKLVAVRQWRVRDIIPPRYWPALLRGAQARGFKTVTLDTLDGLLASKPASASARSVA